MRKTDKKLDNALRVALTEVCDVAQVEFEGFLWLTHFARYDYFPGSLLVVCVFDTNENLAKINLDTMRRQIKNKLASINVRIKDVEQQVSFDTEEQCILEHKGKWNLRFK